MIFCQVAVLLFEMLFVNFPSSTAEVVIRGGGKKSITALVRLYSELGKLPFFSPGSAPKNPRFWKTLF